MTFACLKCPELADPNLAASGEFRADGLDDCCEYPAGKRLAEAMFYSQDPYQLAAVHVRVLFSI